MVEDTSRDRYVGNLGAFLISAGVSPRHSGRLQLDILHIYIVTSVAHPTSTTQYFSKNVRAPSALLDVYVRFPVVTRSLCPVFCSWGFPPSWVNDCKPESGLSEQTNMDSFPFFFLEQSKMDSSPSCFLEQSNIWTRSHFALAHVLHSSRLQLPVGGVDRLTPTRDSGSLHILTGKKVLSTHVALFKGIYDGI